MKKILILQIFLVFSQTVFSQYDIMGIFNSNYIGRNVALTLKRDFKPHSIMIGLKYNINSFVSDNQNNVFFKRFFGKKPSEHLGFNLGYEFNFHLSKSAIRPYIFYDLQYSNSHTRNEMYLPYDIDSNGDILFKEYLEYFGPTIAIENNIGVGYNIELSNRLFLYQKIGAGIVVLGNIDKSIVGARKWELGYLFSFGIGYHLRSKT